MMFLVVLSIVSMVAADVSELGSDYLPPRVESEYLPPAVPAPVYGPPSEYIPPAPQYIPSVPVTPSYIPPPPPPSPEYIPAPAPVPEYIPPPAVVPKYIPAEPAPVFENNEGYKYKTVKRIKYRNRA